MKVILQAVKAILGELSKKLYAAINALDERLTGEITTAQATADNAQTAADNAQSTANTAQSTANTANTTAKAAQTAANNAQSTADKKMNQSDPSGTGAFSLNRKADSAVGWNSSAEGYETTASASVAHSEGWQTTASGSQSHAEGANTTASGPGAHAEGRGTVAEGEASHSEGMNTVARNNYSHAEGNRTTAAGLYSHTEGMSDNLAPAGFTNSTSNEEIISSWSESLSAFTFAKGFGAHCEGHNALALGNYSHAEGTDCHAIGNNSHAEGHGTIAGSRNQLVHGKYNIEDSEGKFLHIVGRGDTENTRANAYTLDTFGNAWYAGTVESTGLILTAPGGKRFKTTVDDSGTLTTAEVTA